MSSALVIGMAIFCKVIKFDLILIQIDLMQQNNLLVYDSNNF